MEETESLNQELPFYLASPKHRFGGAMVGLGLEITIAFIGSVVIFFSTSEPHSAVRTTTPSLEYFSYFFIFILCSAFTWARGQTLAHFFLKMRVFSTDTGKPARWRHMALRCFIIPISYPLIAQLVTLSGEHLFHSHPVVVLGEFLVFGFTTLDALWIFTGTRNQRLVDVFAHTVVVNLSEPNPYAAAVS